MVDLGIDKKDLPKLITKLEKDMHKAAKILDFERAAEIRDQLKNLEKCLKNKEKARISSGGYLHNAILFSLSSKL